MKFICIMFFFLQVIAITLAAPPQSMTRIQEMIRTLLPPATVELRGKKYMLEPIWNLQQEQF